MTYTDLIGCQMRRTHIWRARMKESMKFQQAKVSIIYKNDGFIFADIIITYKKKSENATVGNLWQPGCSITKS